MTISAMSRTSMSIRKRKSFFKKLIDVAVPVIGTVLTFVPGAQADRHGHQRRLQRL